VGPVWPTISGRWGRPHQPFLVSENYDKRSFIWQACRRGFFRFVTMHASVRKTDRQTDKRTADRKAFAMPRDARCITCSRTIKTLDGRFVESVC